MSILAVDVGNTRLKWALYAEPDPSAELLAQGGLYAHLARLQFSAHAGNEIAG